MRLYAYPIVPILIAYISGIVLEYYFSFSKSCMPIGGLVVFLLIFCLYKKLKLRKYLFEIFVYFISFSLGVFSKYNSNTKVHALFFDQFLHNNKAVVKAEVVQVLKTTTSFNNYIIEVDQCNGHKSIGKILFHSKNSLVEGQIIKMKIQPHAIEYLSLPYTFDYQQYLANQNVFYENYTKNRSEVKMLNQTTWRYYLFKIKRDIINKWNKYFPKSDEYSLLKALILGEKTVLSKELMFDYQHLGLLHIIAISGMHIALLYAIILFLLKPLYNKPNGRFYVFLIALSLLWIYAIITGFSASVVRAVVLFSLIEYGKLWKRENSVVNASLVSAFLLLLFNPNYLWDVGFQLSYAAIFGILLFQKFGKKYTYSNNYGIRKVKELLWITTCAQMGVLPLSLYYFGQFPILFLIANLIIIPLSNIVLVVGIISIPVIMFADFVAKPIAFLLYEFILLMNNIVEFCSKFNLSLDGISFHPVLVIMGYGLVFCVYLLLKNKDWKTVKMTFFLILIFQLTYISIYFYNKSTSNWYFVAKNRNCLVLNKRNDSVCYQLKNNDVFVDKAVLEIGRKLFSKNTNKTPFKNFHIVNKRRIIILDNQFQNPKNLKADWFILHSNPRVNLERLIKDNPNATFVISFYNPNYLKEKWEQTLISYRCSHQILNKDNYLTL